MANLPENLERASKLLAEASALICRSLTTDVPVEPFAAHNFAEAVELSQRARKNLQMGHNIIRGEADRASFR